MRDVSAQIAMYEPRAIPPEAWAAVSSHVRQLVEQLNPQSVPQAREALMKLSPYLAWCWQVGYPLDTAHLTNVRLLDDYLAHVDRTRGRAATRHARDKLNVYVRRLAGPARPDFGPTRIALTSTAYTPDELIAIGNWAKAQPTAQWRQNATAVAALAGGCGLRASELIQVRNRDIQTRGTRVAIRVEGDSPRFAPVQKFWEKTFTRLLETTAPDEYVFDISEGARTARKVPVFIGNSRHHEVRPTVERLRATWIYSLVASFVPADLILQVAGLKSAISLNPYLAQLPSRADTEANWELIHSAGRR